MKETTNSAVMTAATGPVRGSAKVKIERTSDRSGLDITVQFNGEPTEETYEYVKDFVDFKLQQMKKVETSS